MEERGGGIEVSRKEPDFFVRAKREKKQRTSFKAKCMKYGSGVRASGVGKLLR